MATRTRTGTKEHGASREPDSLDFTAASHRPLSTFTQLVKEAEKELGHQMPEKPRWWQWRHNAHYDCRKAGSQEICRDEHTPHTKKFILNFSLWQWFGWIIAHNLLMSLTARALIGDPFPWWISISASVASLLATNAGIGIFDLFRHAKAVWRAHELQQREPSAPPDQLVIQFVQKKLGEHRACMTGPDAELTQARRRLQDRMEKVRSLAFQFNGRIAHRQDPALRESLLDGRRRSQDLLTKLTQAEAKLGDYVARVDAFFRECEIRVDGLSTMFADRALLAELDRHETDGILQAERVDELIVLATVRLQAEFATLQESVVRVASSATWTDDAEDTAQTAVFETVIAEAMEALPAPPDLTPLTEAELPSE